MKFPNDFPIAKRWPARTPDRLQLYSFPTPNGIKVSIMLEEIGLPYEVHRVTLAEADVRSPEFLSLNPNNKIPAIIDPNGPDGAAMGLWESGAILIYLADKVGALLPTQGAKRFETLQWLMFQMGGTGPMFGQLGYFHKLAGAEIEDPRPKQRYVTEAKRLLAVLETELRDKDWITGTYSIADIAICSWFHGLELYGTQNVVGWANLPTLQDYYIRFLDRPAVQRGMITPPRHI